MLVPNLRETDMGKITDISTPKARIRVFRSLIRKTKLRLFLAYVRRDIAIIKYKYHGWRKGIAARKLAKINKRLEETDDVLRKQK